MSFIGRDWQDKDEEVIRLNADTLTWEPQGVYRDALAEAREGRQQAKAAAVWEALPEGPPGLTKEELEKATGLGRNRVSQGLTTLGSKVGHSGKARSYKDPLRFWRA